VRFRNRLGLSLAALLGLIIEPGFRSVGAENDRAAALVRTGEAELRVAAAGDAGAADRAFAAFDAALAADPAHVHARAGRGAALVARALYAPLPEKLALARRGCADLDDAVAAAPHDPAVRLRRATNAVQMPLRLVPRDVAEQDFALLLAAARDATVTMAPSTRRGIFYQAAAFALKERRPGAIELLEEAASIAAAEPTDEQVQSMLALARRQLTSSTSTHADRHPPEEAPAPGS